MPRITTRHLMIAIAAIALIIGAVIEWRRDPEPVELALPPPRANADHEIFDLVLTDLIDYGEFDPAIGGRNVPKSEIVVSDQTWGSITKNSVFLTNHPWYRAGKITPDIFADLAARNPKGKRFALVDYQPSSPKILLRDMKAIDEDLGFAAQFPNARGYVIFRMPGYALDGQTVVVLFAFGPTPHGAGGLYLLKKVSRRWEIVDRNVHYYL